MSNIAVVRRAVTSFVENMANAIPEELTTNPNSPLHHLNTPNQRVGCARTYEVDKVHMLECFVVLFDLFVNKNVGIWINTFSDIDRPPSCPVGEGLVAGDVGFFLSTCKKGNSKLFIPSLCWLSHTMAYGPSHVGPYLHDGQSIIHNFNVATRFDTNSEDRDEVVFVNQDHWIPVFRKPPTV